MDRCRRNKAHRKTRIGDYPNAACRSETPHASDRSSRSFWMPDTIQLWVHLSWPYPDPTQSRGTAGDMHPYERTCPLGAKQIGTVASSVGKFCFKTCSCDVAVLKKEVASTLLLSGLRNRYAPTSVLPSGSAGVAAVRVVWWEDAASGTSNRKPELSLKPSSRKFSVSSAVLKRACRLFPSSILSNRLSLLFEAIRNVRHSLLARAFVDSCLSSSVFAV